MNDPAGRRIRINSPEVPEVFPRGADQVTRRPSVPISFDALVFRIRALTLISPRRASLVAGEFECATRVIDPRQPSDMELVVKAKDLGYLPLEWRLPG